MKRIDEIATQKDERLNYFLSEDGLIFEENFHILFAEIIQSSFSSLMDLVKEIEDRTVSIEFMTNEEERILGSEELNQEQRERVRDIFSNIKEQIDHVEKIGKRIPELYAELHSITNDPIYKDISEEVEAPTGVKESETKEEEIKTDVLSRLIACFVFSLYAYMDVYCMSIFQSIICCCSPEHLFDVYDLLKSATNPNRSTEAILKTISVLNEEKEKELLNTVIQCFNSNIIWKEKFGAFKTLIKIRNKIAHRRPFLNIEELKQEFPEIAKETKKQMEEHSLELEEILNGKPVRISIADDMIKAFWSNIKNVFHVREIGLKSSHYLAFIDGLVYEFLNDLNCLDENQNNSEFNSEIDAQNVLK